MMRSKSGGRRGLGHGKGWRTTGGGGRVWLIRCNLWWDKDVGYDVVGAPGRPYIHPIFGLDIRGVGQFGHLRPI